MAQAIGSDWNINPRGDGLLYMEDVDIGAGIDPVADWALRSGDPGVMLAENFDYPTYNDAKNAPNVWGVSDNYPRLITLQPEHGLSGKSLRIHWTPDANSGCGTYIVAVSGDASNLGFNQYVFTQYIVWGDDVWNVSYALDGTSNFRAGEAKFIIIGEHDNSADVGRFVHTNSRGRMTVNGYRTSPGNRDFNNVSRVRSTPANSQDEQFQNAIDGGTPSNPATNEDFMTRYGDFRYAGEDGANGLGDDLQWNIGLTPEEQGFPRVAVGNSPAGLLQRGTWNVFEALCDVANDRLILWHAAYGDDPKLVADTLFYTGRGSTDSRPPDGTAGLPSNKNYTGLHLTHFITGKRAMNAALNATYNTTILDPDVHYLDYSEVITSTNPIPFPGNKPLPGGPF